MTTPNDRFPAIDIARGFAVMGILALNIIAFAMPEAAYFNPRAWGGTSLADIGAWALSFILIDGKMRGLFSLLFGASMLLAMDKAEMEGRNGRTAHIVRAFWLAMIGLAHYLLLWWGDILLLYAAISLIALVCTGKQPVALVKLAFLAFAAHFVILIGLMLNIYGLQNAAIAPDASPMAAQALTDMLARIGQPGTPDIAHEVALYRGAFAPMLADRANQLPGWILSGFQFMALDTLGFMLLGMAMLKAGFLTGQWPAAQYYMTARHCFLIGLPPMVALAAWAIWSGFDTVTTFGIAFAWSFPLRIPLTVGFAALIFRAAVRARPGALLKRIGAAGRMTLTNYLATSLVMTGIFYGWGLGWFGMLSRAQSYLLLLPMWLLMLGWSQPWLKAFRYGPAEWLWRSLERGKAMPMRRRGETPA